MSVIVKGNGGTEVVRVGPLDVRSKLVASASSKTGLFVTSHKHWNEDRMLGHADQTFDAYSVFLGNLMPNDVPARAPVSITFRNDSAEDISVDVHHVPGMAR
jgi:hypothetical protein